MQPPDAQAGAGFSIHATLAEQHTSEDAEALLGRLQELDSWMRATSPYTLRDDSRLAYRFVTGQLPMWSGAAVAHEMACVQYLSSSVPFHEMSQPFLRTLATRLKHETGVADWKTVWHAVADLGPEMLKLHLMHEYRLTMPDFAPAMPPPDKEEEEELKT